MKRIVLGVCGASGAAYARRAVEVLSADPGLELHLAVSAMGEKVFAAETGSTVDAFLGELPESSRTRIRRHRSDDLFAPISSGSFATAGMLVLPCSMAALASIAVGTGGDLLRRAADVHLKERRPLVLVPRETPLSVVHLRNMLALAEAGAVVLPASPGFYGRPERIGELVDFVVGRALAALGLETDLAPVWTGE